jgi:uncharacterized phage-associated protein
MKIPLRKLKAIILYFCENTDSKFLGKVKLMKLFYYLDFTHLKNYGSPITFDRYVKLEHGPIPSTIKNLVDDAGEDVDHSVLADTIDIERPDGTNMYKVVARRKLTKTDMDLFSEAERKTLSQVCVRFGSKNTQYIEETSHDEAPWKDSQMFQEIPYSLAAKDSDCKVAKEDIELLLQIVDVK